MWAFGFGGSGFGIRVVEETQFSSSVARFLCAWDTDVGFRF